MMRSIPIKETLIHLEVLRKHCEYWTNVTEIPCQSRLQGIICAHIQFKALIATRIMPSYKFWFCFKENVIMELDAANSH